ncbi:MAG: sugar phosphate isomerase/epimerase family protein [Candidatus Caldatribacteriaceae bacterium]
MRARFMGLKGVRCVSLKYAVHAYAWTSKWSSATLNLIDRAKEFGFDLIEIPLMDIDLIDPPRIKERLDRVGIGIITSTALQEFQDVTSDDPDIRRKGIEYLIRCVRVSAELGAKSFSGVIYSAMGKKIDTIPGEIYWERASSALKEVARVAQDFGMVVGIEPINRYETFLINTCEQALLLREMIGEPNVGIHLDTYHMNIEENNFYDPTKKALPYLCHYHLSESHRGTPGTGTVNWDEVFKALAEGNYQGTVGMESFVEVAESMRPATCIWRKLAPSTEFLLREGLKFLKDKGKKYYGLGE